MSFSRLFGIALVAVSLLTLSACENAKDKAQRKYENAVALLEAGQASKADVELRGVFDLNPEHYDARMLYASLRHEAGDLQEAAGHYRIAFEQYPDAVEPRVELAEIYVSSGIWDEIDPIVEVAARNAPDNLRVQTLLLAIELRDAIGGGQAELEHIIGTAKDLLVADPELRLARNLLIDSLLRTGDLYGALEVLDEGLGMHPDDRASQENRLRLLNQLGDTEGVGVQLRNMVEQFPDTQQYQRLLVQWYTSRDDIVAAEEFMRGRVEARGDEAEPKIEYVQFLVQTAGPERAIEQLDDYIAQDADNLVFGLLRASIKFDMGEREEAIAALSEQLRDAPSSNETRDQQVTLARMYMRVGQRDEAHAIVDTVLEQDAFHVEALKLRADRLIDSDRVGDAILTLRSALDQEPQDADLRTLMAKAYERDGIRDLMGENLSLAAQNSNFAVTESIRYGRFLMTQEKFQSARDVVVQSLRRHPRDLQLLQILSEIYLGLADYPRAEQIVKALRNHGDERAELLASGLEATILQRLQRTDESLDLLRGMLDDESTALVARAAIIRTHLANGEVEAARSFMDEIVEQAPEEAGVRFLNAALLTVEGNVEDALEIYRGLVEDDPYQEVVWRAYVAGLMRLERTEDAMAILKEAIEALPDARNLLWLQASQEEQRGNIEVAIQIYESLYEKESNSMIVANNLASLLSSFRNDGEDLRRAAVIARRLKDTSVPAFQDTYGWIAYRMGRTEEALTYLQQAAEGLPTDPTVREHLGTVFAALDMPQQAISEYEVALEILGDSDQRASNRIIAALDKARANASEAEQ